MMTIGRFRFSLFFLAITPLAHAESAAPPTTSVSDGGQVIVTANRLAVQNLVDRKVYTIAADLQSLTGTVSDVLGQIPSVQLDVDGNVSLRGDSNVLILIDGRPSAQLQGGSVGDVLQQMGAAEVERIEVITNPPAQFKAEGTAGVINIVTRRARADGGTGTVQANVGNHDRWMTGAGGSYRHGAFAVTSNAAVRFDERQRHTSDDRRSVDPATGDSTHVLRSQDETIRRLLPSLKLSGEWKPDRRQTLTLALSRSERHGRGRHLTEDDRTVSPEGQLVAESTRISDGHEKSLEHGETLSYERTTAIKDEKLTVSVGRTYFDEQEQYRYANASLLPTQSLPGDGYRFGNESEKRLANMDYARPLGSHQSLKAGLAYEDGRNGYDNGGETQSGGGVWVDNPLQSNRFQYRQQIESGYGSFQTEQNGWTALAGVRLEQVRVHITPYDGLAPAPTQDTKAFPSLHVEHPVGESGTWTANLGRRITRPDPQALDPHIDHEDVHNLRVGNPSLRPQTTVAVETGYAFEGVTHSWSATAYLRDIHDAYTEVVTVLDPQTVLSSRSNIDHSHSGGLEFGTSGRLWPKVSYNLSGNLNRYSIQFPGLPARAGNSLSTKASVDVRMGTANTWQVAYANYGKRITPQGSFVPVGAVNLGFRHTIDTRWSGVVTVTDLFNTQAWRRETSTSTLSEVFERKPLGRLFFVGLVYQVGASGKKSRRESFDYDAGGG